MIEISTYQPIFMLIILKIRMLWQFFFFLYELTWNNLYLNENILMKFTGILEEIEIYYDHQTTTNFKSVSYNPGSFH